MTRVALLVALLAGCKSDRPAAAKPPQDAAAAVKQAPPTCAEMARRGVELALADESVPVEMRAELEATRDQAIAGGTAQCEQLKPPPEVLACMVAAKTYAEYAACGAKFQPE